MTTTPTSRHDTATRFLTALAAPAAADELLELRYRLADGQRMGQVFESPARVRGLATRAIALGRRTDVYVGCAPRTRRHGGRDAVERAFVLWADCDGDQAVAALRGFEPAPAIVIASGTGCNCHAYWPLTGPLERDEVERANRRLAHALGADSASADAARILRVPGTLSHKHMPPTPVQRSTLIQAASLWQSPRCVSPSRMSLLDGCGSLKCGGTRQRQWMPWPRSRPADPIAAGASPSP